MSRSRPLAFAHLLRHSPTNFYPFLCRCRCTPPSLHCSQPKPRSYSTKSSKVWLARQLRDPYVKARNSLSLPSRSAFKLMEINEKYGNFLEKDDVRVVVDLGAAPGGWVRVCAEKLAGIDPEKEKEKERREKKAKLEKERSEKKLKEEEEKAREQEDREWDEDAEEDQDEDEDEDGYNWDDRSIPMKRPRSQKLKKRDKVKMKLEEERNATRANPNATKAKDDVYDLLNIDDVFPPSPRSSRRSSSPSPKLSSKTKMIIALDLLTIPRTNIPSPDDIPNVRIHTIKADFLDSKTEGLIRDLIPPNPEDEEVDFGWNRKVDPDDEHPLETTPSTPKVDIILSDIAVNFSGNPTRDSETSYQVCLSVWEFARRYLRSEGGGRRGGVLVIKHFPHPSTHAFRMQTLVPNFHKVYYVKPEASRGESAEGYFVCRGLRDKETVEAAVQ
ncbi:hypothetical protein D9758_012290 [Tetrapyrgos nigripes]|uniref:rRNA methyltransferase 2, mitochondrial n=1 Tax=Tetrapyrgos nigripes TaxID=182062 RepID=A0A8H5CGM2_9AGAR|nr:hypothetical protein D9758_012290 [Tetrapyrgos nigripes]